MLTLNGVASTTGVLVDALAPTPASLTRVDATPSNHSSLSYTLIFSEGVSGVDVSDLTVVTTGTASGSISSITLVDAKTYTVLIGSVTGVGTLRVDLNASGTGIVDGAGNALGGSGLTGELYDVDHVAPVVSAATVPAGTYGRDQNLDITVTFSEAVLVNTSGGTLRLSLTVGGVVRSASYLSGSGSTALVFRYVVQSDEKDLDGIALGASLEASGGTLRDAAGNDADLTLHGVAPTNGVLVNGQAKKQGAGDVWYEATHQCGLGSGVALIGVMALLALTRLRLGRRVD